jgi:hypothetical protein
MSLKIAVIAVIADIAVIGGLPRCDRDFTKGPMTAMSAMTRDHGDL